jgi:hypothetical protein
VDFYEDFLINNKRHLTRDLWAKYDLQYYATDERPYLEPPLETTGYVRNTRWAENCRPTITEITTIPEIIPPEGNNVPVTLDVKVKHHSEEEVNAKIISVKVSGTGQGLMSDQYEVTGPLSLKLNLVPGISYLVKVLVTDENGHRDRATVTIPVA